MGSPNSTQKYLELCRWPTGYRCECGSTSYLFEFISPTSPRGRAAFVCAECGRAVDVFRVTAYRRLARVGGLRTAALVCMVYNLPLERAAFGTGGALIRALNEDGLSFEQLGDIFDCGKAAARAACREAKRKEQRRERKRQDYG